jgi:hypothetical protein
MFHLMAASSQTEGLFAEFRTLLKRFERPSILDPGES